MVTAPPPPPKVETQNPTISIRVGEDFYPGLKRIAEQFGVTPGVFVRETIQRYVKGSGLPELAGAREVTEKDLAKVGQQIALCILVALLENVPEEEIRAHVASFFETTEG